MPKRELQCWFSLGFLHDEEPRTPLPTIDQAIGNTPLVRLQRLPGAENLSRGNVILGKLEGHNPGGSVKDRPAYSMIRRAEERGEIRPGDRLIEATSGNTGIALSMIAAMKGYRMTLLMPDNLSAERRASMIVLVLFLTVLSAVFGINFNLGGRTLDVGALAVFSLVVGFTGAFISLLLSKTMAKWSTGAQVIKQPSNAMESCDRNHAVTPHRRRPA